MPATVASPARIEANRRNARKSTGPRTAAGKERSRTNALKHGLTGAGIALPDEDRGAIEERFGAIRAELAPSTALGAILAGQVAMMSVRIERAARQEAAALTHRALHAPDAYDDARAGAAAACFAGIEADPALNRKRLLRTPEGVDLLVDALESLQAILARGWAAWTPERTVLAEACCGRRAGASPPSPIVIYARAVDGYFGRIEPSEYAECTTDIERRRWAADRLRAAIAAEVAELLDHRATLDHAAIARDRAGAATRALFDPGREATLARRYEAASSRAFHRALREFRAVEADADQAEADSPASSTPAVPSGNPPAPSAPAPADDEKVDPKSSESNEIWATLGSFGRTTPVVPTPMDRAAEIAEHRRNRPRIDRLEKRNRRRQ